MNSGTDTTGSKMKELDGPSTDVKELYLLLEFPSYETE